jgi:malto-oligosyltrehalose trehalohydrolase
MDDILTYPKIETSYRFGPRACAGGGFEFRLWAPAAASVEVHTPGRTDLMRQANGWHTAVVADVRNGTHYKFTVDGRDVPDPASSFQPEDIFGPSEIIDHHFPWQAHTWRGRPWHEAVIQEIHVGTFTPEGTFCAAIGKLDEVVQSGFTAIELMPVADFPGRRNWGYDGVLWYAPDSIYGRPEELKAFVDAAHLRGLMVFLDVVYNHFGPEGNFLSLYAPAFFTNAVETPWGAAIDFAVPEVRAFVIENALHWLDRYRFDGLRLDAVHAISRRGEPSILTDLGQAVEGFARRTGRQIHLVLENDDNDAGLLEDLRERENGRYRAQWNDDYHHAWHVLLTGEQAGYYGDYATDPLNAIARSLSSGFVYQGEASRHRNGRARGTSSVHLPPLSFVSFLQNHDQVGNRALGERLDTLAVPVAVEAALAVMLMAPMPPLLFMGEEWGESRPFPFFCDFKGKLADAVRAGRRKEFAAAYKEQGVDVPDPLSEETFIGAKIDWRKLTQGDHAKRRKLVRSLLACRARNVVPHLPTVRNGGARARVTGTVVTVAWEFAGGTLHLLANLGPEKAGTAPLPGKSIWNQMEDQTVPPWSVYWSWV